MNVVWAAIICIALFIIIWYQCWGSAHRRRHTLGETDSSQATGAVESQGLRSPVEDSQHARSDDLTRIKGIGNVIERKLHTLGITTFEQIANFETADIERVNQVVDFAGRIEREKWVEQARGLARP